MAGMKYKPPIELALGLPKFSWCDKTDAAVLSTVEQVLEVKVDKDELLRALRYDRDQYNTGYRDGRADAIENLYPGSDELTAQIREAIRVQTGPAGKVEFRVVRHGEWLGGWDYECSVYGMDAEYKTQFCPNCGAEMDGGGAE